MKRLGLFRALLKSVRRAVDGRCTSNIRERSLNWPPASCASLPPTPTPALFRALPPSQGCVLLVAPLHLLLKDALLVLQHVADDRILEPQAVGGVLLGGPHGPRIKKRCEW